MSQFCTKNATDAELLQRFDRLRDQESFSELVRRHGGMVLATAQRVLGRREDAEDACQATFLALARSVGSFRKKSALPGWLHTTSRRCAIQILRRNRRRAKEIARSRLTEAEDDPMISLNEYPEEKVHLEELARLLDQEMSSLPSPIRDAVVLCELEGMSHRAAAHQLGVSVASIGNYVKKGRELLRSRLARRGVTLSVAALAAWGADCQSASAALTNQFVSTLTTNATHYAVGKSAAGTGAAAHVVACAERVSWWIFADQWKNLVICGLVACLVLPPLAKLSVAISKPEPPTPIHHWRFEPELGFLEDSIGHARLAPINPGIVPVSIPNGARAANFPPLVDGSLNNSTAADCQRSLGALSCPSANPIEEAFTIEAIVSADNLTPINGTGEAVLAAQGTDCTSPDLISWSLSIHRYRKTNIAPRELVLAISDGKTLHDLPSGFRFEVGRDYYVSAAFDLSSDVRFYAKDLSTGEVYSNRVSHSVNQLNPHAKVFVGGSPYSWAFFDGIIDEVRLSRGVLAVNDLLINGNLNP